jgi:hypothetical protein
MIFFVAIRGSVSDGMIIFKKAIELGVSIVCDIPKI